jgi:hypothetical protein
MHFFMTVPLPRSKVFTIDGIVNDAAFFYSADNDMMQGAGGVQSGAAWHGVPPGF